MEGNSNFCLEKKFGIVGADHFVIHHETVRKTNYKIQNVEPKKYYNFKENNQLFQLK